MDNQKALDEDVHTHTPAGKTGVEDMRMPIGRHGEGKVADASRPENHSTPKGDGPKGIEQTPEIRRHTDDPADMQGGGDISGETMSDVNTNEQAVDGYTDTKGDTDVASPDPGNKPKIEPLNPDEYAKAQKEARTEDKDK